MPTVFFRNRTYNFQSYQAARQFESENPGAVVATPQQQSYDEQPRPQRQHRPPPLKSIIPRAQQYRPFRQPLFNPKTSKKLYGDDEYE